MFKDLFSYQLVEIIFFSLTCSPTGLYGAQMEKSDTKLKSTTKRSENTFQRWSPDVTVNQIFSTHPHNDGHIPNCCVDPGHFCHTSPCRLAGQVKQDFWQPAYAAQHHGLQHGDPEDRGATRSTMNLYPCDKRQACCCWKCGPNQGGTAGPANRGAAGWGTSRKSKHGEKYALWSIRDEVMHVCIRIQGWR